MYIYIYIYIYIPYISIWQISGIVLGTKFTPLYAFDFLDSENVKPWLWLIYIDYIFFI